MQRPYVGSAVQYNLEVDTEKKKEEEEIYLPRTITILNKKKHNINVSS